MSAAVLQLHHREVFEQNVTWAVAAGAVAGALQSLLERYFVAPPWPYLVMVGVALSAVRGDRLDKLLLSALAVALPSLSWSAGMSAAWTVIVAGAGTGTLMVRARLSDRGEEGQLATDRPGALNYVVGAGLGAALGGIGTEVARILALRLASIATPALLSWVLCGAIVALFLSLASMAAHLALRPDPVEARCEDLLCTLSGEFHALGTRALTLYRRCGEAMSRLPRDPAREELARTLSEMTRGAVELASEWSGVEDELEERTGQELEAEISSLQRSAETAQDPVARRQLELAAESLQEERARVEDLRRRRERILAKLKAEVALLERARVALLGMRSGHAQLRAAELSALARRLSSLARVQHEEASVAEEVTRAH